jgi:hypothetical protein
MNKFSPWLGRFLFAMPFAGFGAFVLLTLLGARPKVFPDGQWTVPAKWSVDWWLSWGAGWVFLGAAAFIILNGDDWLRGQVVLRTWIQDLAFVVLFVLFLIPLNLLLVSPLSKGEVTFHVFFLTYSGPGAGLLNRLAVGLIILVFDLFGIALIRRFVRQTRRLLQAPNRKSDG